MGKFIGIYGGSFNPIHFGHLNLASEMMEIHQLDEVWFCPTACSPHKESQNLISACHRLHMLHLAIEEEPRFLVSDIEINREAPSYTIETLNALTSLQVDQANPDCFALILGQDAARHFYKWHQPDAIVNQVPLLVGRRSEGADALEPFQGSSKVIEAITKGLTRTRLMEISSSEIRQRVLNNKYCYHLVPAKVMDYIIRHDLYCLALNEVRFL